MGGNDNNDDTPIYDAVSQALRQLPTTGTYNARNLGYLKSLDEVVEAADDGNFKKVPIRLALRDKALAALPQNMAGIVEASKGGSGLALELVRMDLTQLPVLSATLYSATEEQRKNSLRVIYNALAPLLELHGALTSSGIDVEDREWARALVSFIPNLRRLRSTPWHEVAIVLKLITVDADGETGEAKGADMYDGSAPWENPPTRAEIRIIEELYSFGPGAPAIRRQVLSARLGLDVADQLEDMGIYDAGAMTPEDTRSLTELALEQLEEEQDEDNSAAAKDLGGVNEATRNADGIVSTSRALPALAGIAAKLAPTILKAAPKLSKVTKLVGLGSKGKGGIGQMGNKLNALVSNAGSGGSGGASGSSGSPPDAVNDGLSGLVTGIEQVKQIKELLTPDVEAGVAAIELEKARLQATMDSVRLELEKVSVDGKTEEALEQAQTALDKARASVAPIEGWQDRIPATSVAALQTSLQDQRLSLGTGNIGTGAYATNEELVAKASGGTALYGVNFFPTLTDMVLKPYTPLLAPPSYVEMSGAVSTFQANVWQTTSISEASTFHNISNHAGISVALKTARSTGSSGSASTFFASGSASSGTTSTYGMTQAQIAEFEKKRAQSSSTSTASVIEYINCPMKSFRIPMARMQLSEDAYKTALAVNSIRDAEEFLDDFGSHVSNGRQELGGIFFSTMTIRSRELVASESMIAAASSEASVLREKATQTSGGGSVGFFGLGGKAASSMGSATSVGLTKVNTTGQASGTEQRNVEASYSQYIRCTGPRAPTPETFAEALFNDNSSWAVTDRGPTEALVPVTRVIENTIEVMSEDDPDKPKLETAVRFVTAAWRMRARSWGDVLLGEENEAKNDTPKAVLDLIRTAYPVAQGVVQDLITAVYNCLQFVYSDSHVNFWGDAGQLAAQNKVDSLALATLVADGIREAATRVTGGTPAILAFLDTEDMKNYVIGVMRNKESVNKEKYVVEAKELGLKNPELSFDALPILKRLGGRPEDFNKLPEWQQRWIEKEDEFAQENQGIEDEELKRTWNTLDLEVFQREYFKPADPSKFLPELEEQMVNKFVMNATKASKYNEKGIVVRVVRAPQTAEEVAAVQEATVGTEAQGDGDSSLVSDSALEILLENVARRSALSEATLAMKSEDWVIFDKVWNTNSNPEETKRVVKIIEDHVNVMKAIHADLASVRASISKEAERLSRLQSAQDVAKTFLKEKENLVEALAGEIKGLQEADTPDDALIAEKTEEMETARSQSELTTNEAFKEAKLELAAVHKDAMDALLVDGQLPSDAPDLDAYRNFERLLAKAEEEAATPFSDDIDALVTRAQGQVSSLEGAQAKAFVDVRTKTSNYYRTLSHFIDDVEALKA